MSLFLGIDTSNYTTSVATFENSLITHNLKKPVYVKPGERGARQSDAVFSHVKNFPEIMHELGEIKPTAIGVSIRPRDVEGSYMPCFLSGYAVASALASSFNVPLYTFSHQAGHVRAALYSSGRLDLIGETFIAFHVSGGTTEVLLCENDKISCVGGTCDINAGQLIDRIGVALGLSFPCGKELEMICDFEAMKRERLSCRISVNGLNANLSGLENKAINYLKNGASKQAVAAFIISSIEKTLCALANNAREIYGSFPIIFSGGVSSNRHLRSSLQRKFGAFFAEPSFSADNAAGISLLCHERYLMDHGI